MTMRGLLLAALAPLTLALPRGDAPPRRITLFPITLNDVSLQPVSPELRGRMQRMTVALRERLTTACGYEVVAPDSGSDAGAGAANYLYAHPEVAVGLAVARSEWVVVPRLNRASPWVTDLQANVVRVRDSTLVSNRIVEVKGIELSPELAERLIERGAAWMADQLSQAVEHSSSAADAVTRRCPA